MMLLALTPPRPADGSTFDGRGGRLLEAEHAAQRETQQAGTSHTQDGATGHAQMRVAQVFAGLTGDDDHRCASLSRVLLVWPVEV